jgi:hypothetical protein
MLQLLLAICTSGLEGAPLVGDSATVQGDASIDVILVVKFA